MSADFEIVKYNSEFKRPVAQFQKQLWSSDAGLNERYFEWKYEGNPHLRKSHVYLAIHRNQVVGMRGFHAARLEAGTPSRAFSVLIAGDALVAPHCRDRGLVSRILKTAYSDLAEREYDYALSLGGASRINALGLMALGWKSGGGLQPMGRISTAAKRSQTLRQTLKRVPLLWRFGEARSLYSADQRKPFRHLDRTSPGRGAGADFPIIVSREARVDAMAELALRVGHDGRIRYVRDREYLAWRFRNPLSDYRYLYWEDEHLEGYLVLCSRASDLGAFYRVYVADLVASSARVRSDLLAAAARWGRFPEVVTWTATLPEDELQDLSSQGFVPVDHEDTARGCPCILVRPIRTATPPRDWSFGERRLLDMTNWDVRPLFSMRA
jgi:hypothetical protein